MEVSGVTLTGPSAASSAPTEDPAATSVQKKAPEIQEQSVTAVVESVPDPESSVGQNVDEHA